MNPQQNISLAKYSTMGLGGDAAYLVEVSSRNQLRKALDWAKTKQLPAVMIGGGSNIIWGDEGYAGLVIIDQILGYELNGDKLTIGSGESWDAVVEQTVAAGLSGIEALSLIPGTAGATPIQNVGAYGQEISETLISLEAFDSQVNDFVTIANADCRFSYRNSRFKSGDHGRFYITSVTLQLAKANPQPPFYAAVQEYFAAHGITDYTPSALRQAVIAIRTAKLPDPAVIHNTGSFFANPIVDEAQLASLTSQFDKIPAWPIDTGGAKVSAAWLIEQAGFKDYHDAETGMATWPRQPLVLVNEHAKTTADLMKFKQKIVAAVNEKFNITLEQEPELLSGN